MTAQTVLLFARYAEVLGAAEVEVELPVAPTVADLIEALRRLPGGALLPERPFVAINRERARPDQPVLPSDEVAVLPPLAGG